MNHRTLTARPTHLGPREAPAPPTHGMTMAQMAAQERIAHQSKWSLGRAGGVPKDIQPLQIDSGGGRKPSLCEETKDRIYKLTSKGMGRRAIAKELGISDGQAWRFMKSNMENPPRDVPGFTIRKSIIDILADGPRTWEEIGAALNLGDSSAQNHIRKLRESLTVRRVPGQIGQKAFYELVPGMGGEEPKE